MKIKINNIGKINKAEILLLYTSKNISDIALQCGFCDIYSFSHCFKKHTGMSPREYRAAHIWFVSGCCNEQGRCAPSSIHLGYPKTLYNKTLNKNFV